MNRKMGSGIMLTLLFIGMSALAFKVQPVKGWTGTVYIRAYGSIDPPDAPMITYDNVTYTLTDNITGSADGVVVERDNIVLDGAGYTVQGTGSGSGISLSERTNVTISNMEVKAFLIGIYLDNSSKNCISENNIRENSQGIYVYGSNEPHETESWHNTIVGNDITENGGGILLEEAKFNNVSGNNITENHGNVDYPLRPGGIYIFLNSLGNVVSGNNIINNGAGIETYHGDGVGIFENNIKNNNVGLNLFPGHVTAFHNNFISNPHQTVAYSIEENIWDNGCEGNYWSDSNGTDSDGDGIADNPYVIDENNQDNHPLMAPYLVGDMNHDGIVDDSDLLSLSEVYGAQLGGDNWNCHCDFNEDGIVDIYDLALVGKNYGKTA